MKAGKDASADELSKGERSKKKLIDATASLLRRQGFHATGLSQIVAESGAPRGSVYFYFPGGKDDLAVAALGASSDAWRAQILASVAAAPDLAAAVDALIGTLADELEGSGWVNGCPVATVALESPSEPVCRMIGAHFDQWLAIAGQLMVGFGVDEGVAQEIAVVALSAIEGALLLARVKRSRAPLMAVGKALKAMVEPYVPKKKLKR